MTTGRPTTPLPAPTREIARLWAQIGPEATLALVDGWGGRRIYLPKVLDPDNEVARAIGLEAYERLQQWVHAEAADYFKVPVARTWRILVLRQQSMSYGTIAHLVGCSENTVWRTLNARDMTDNQLSLFD